MYRLITDIRNKLFDKNLLRSIYHPEVYILCVGNIRVGGTGKTPMVEHLIQELQGQFPLAVVSLGYKRKTQGLREIQLDDTFLTVGDEPMQMKEKFPHIPFVVNKDRNQAIDYILENHSNTKLIILDDAYQYRKTRATRNILLTEYNRPYFRDKVIPFGRLRESRKSAQRADFIVVTKCPKNINKDDKENFSKQLRASKNQEIFFSTIDYQPLNPELLGKNLILLVGIDNPQPLAEHLQNQCNILKILKYPDHYAFTKKDIEEIGMQAKKLSCPIITTEKDYKRLKNSNLPLYIQKIKIQVDNNFINKISNDVRQFYTDSPSH